MRSGTAAMIAATVALGWAACTGAGDDWTVRPPGGGPGGNGGGDATRPDAAPGDGGSAQLTGLVCVVSDLRAPDACPTATERIGVAVHLAGASGGTTSDSEG